MGFDSPLALALDAAYSAGGQFASRCGSMEIFHRLDNAHVRWAAALLMR